MTAFHLTWVIGLFFVLVVLAGVAILVAWAVSSRSVSATASPATHSTPLEILDRRFAAGEIGADEYKRARDLLGGGGAKT